MLKKQLIVDYLINHLKSELIEIEKAARSSKELATAPDLKSEGKYDTRAIEASYLAGAQSKRVEEIKLDIGMLEDLDISENKTNKIQLGSLVNLHWNNQDRLYFISSTSGGAMVKLEENTVLIISVFSPIGDAALGLSVGDSFEVETPKETRTYLIRSIC